MSQDVLKGQLDDWNVHWDNYDASAPLNPAQTYRRELIYAALSLPTQGAFLIDIGSGQGDFAAETQRNFPQTVILGLELSESGVRKARLKVPTAEFHQRNLLEPAEVPVGFRAWATHAVCAEVLEHLDAPEVLLANVRTYLRPGAKVVVTVPGGAMSYFDKHIGHRQHYTSQALRSLLQRSGYRVRSVYRAGFPFFNLYRLIVIARGRKLVSDVSETHGRISGLARFVMRAFGVLFPLNLRHSPWGWQIVAVAEA